MFDSGLIALMHPLVNGLLQPVIAALFAVVAVVLWDSGVAVSERLVALPRLAATGTVDSVSRLARRRIQRADVITRIGPMLGLMGTLIPLGPGLSALGQGNLEILATAMTVAFDTTVLGLLAGIAGYVLGRLRRQWYDRVLDDIEQRGDTPLAGGHPNPRNQRHG
jgi:hypothetical protein